MREIPLSRGKVALVDDDDYERLIAFTWHISTDGYAYRHQRDTRVDGKRKRYSLSMHRYLMGLEYGDERAVDHKNGNKLDNQKTNLRVCTRGENNLNVGRRSNNKSGFKGVYWCNFYKRWVTKTKKDGKRYFIGYFDCPEEAYRAYCARVLELHGEFANLGG
jgi:hypothetical protein